MVLRLLHTPSGQKDGHLIKAPQQKHFQRGSTRRISNTFCDEFFLKTPCSLHDGNGMSGLDWASYRQLMLDRMNPTRSARKTLVWKPYRHLLNVPWEGSLIQINILRFCRVGNLANWATWACVGCIKINLKAWNYGTIPIEDKTGCVCWSFTGERS